MKQRLFSLKKKALLGSFSAVLLADQVLFRVFLPSVRVTRFRAPLFLGKYILLPLVAMKLV